MENIMSCIKISSYKICHSVMKTVWLQKKFYFLKEIEQKNLLHVQLHSAWTLIKIKIFELIEFSHYKLNNY